MKVYKSDLNRIGHTIFDNGGFTTFICHGSTFGIEAILLREILLLLGDYAIISEGDYLFGNLDECDYAFATDLPYSVYLNNCNEY